MVGQKTVIRPRKISRRSIKEEKLPLAYLEMQMTKFVNQIEKMVEGDGRKPSPPPPQPQSQTQPTDFSIEVRSKSGGQESDQPQSSGRNKPGSYLPTETF